MSEFNEPIGSEAPSGVTRRTVTRAMAWAVPVIAVSAAVPAYAASRNFIFLTGEGCKLPGNNADIFKGYAYGVSVTNPFAQSATITINDVLLDGNDLGDILILNLGTEADPKCEVLGTNTFTIAGQTTYSNLVFLSEEAPNSQQGQLTGNYTVTVGGGSGQVLPITGTVPSVPPIPGGGACTDFNDREKACIVSQVGVVAP